MFDWDGGNAEKIRDLHDVEPDEVEEALTDPDRISEGVGAFVLSPPMKPAGDSTPAT